MNVLTKSKIFSVVKYSIGYIFRKFKLKKRHQKSTGLRWQNDGGASLTLD